LFIFLIKEVNYKINNKLIYNFITIFFQVLLIANWGLGIGDWGLGIGVWGVGAKTQTPKPPPPTPKPPKI